MNELAREKTKETAFFHKAIDSFLYVLTFPLILKDVDEIFSCCKRNVTITFYLKIILDRKTR